MDIISVHYSQRVAVALALDATQTLASHWQMVSQDAKFSKTWSAISLLEKFRALSSLSFCPHPTHHVPPSYSSLHVHVPDPDWELTSTGWEKCTIADEISWQLQYIADHIHSWHVRCMELQSLSNGKMQVLTFKQNEFLACASEATSALLLFSACA